MPRERQVDLSVTAIKKELKKKSVYARTEDGGVHMVTGNVKRVNGQIYADTTYGRQVIKSAQVLD